MEKKSWKNLVLGAILMVLAAQMYVEIFSSDLVISVAAVLFPVYAMLWGRYPVLPLAAVVAVGNFLSRVGVYYLRYEAMSWHIYWHEMVFYLVYGLLFAWFMRRVSWEIKRPRQFLMLALVDYLANAAELWCRGVEGDLLRMHLALLAVAATRTVIVWGLWLVLHHQSLMLLRREHAQRYQQLMLLISKLRCEVLWMQKSAGMMENTMSTAYRLYSLLQQEEHPAARQALAVSKDVHEIKKEYQLIIRGLSEAMEEDLERQSVSFRELMTILLEHMDRFAREEGVEVQWRVDLPFDFKTDKHYQLLGILRNLLDNAIESAVDRRTVISLDMERQQGEILLRVTNLGKTIPPESLGRIFDPGFSTKVNFTTGKVGRGVGLCLVRDLTEELGGSIAVASQEGVTSFTIRLSETSLEVRE